MLKGSKPRIFVENVLKDKLYSISTAVYDLDLNL